MLMSQRFQGGQYFDAGLGRLVAVMVMLLSLAACSGVNPGVTELPEPQQDFSSQPYRMGVGDVIRVEVWNNDRLSVEVPVRPDGKISMSLVGDVLAAGNTTEELGASIASKLLKFIKNPQVAIIVVNPSSTDFQQRIRVTGAVRNPVSVPYRKGMTVLDLVLLAGGPNEFSLPDESKLYRRVEGAVKVFPIYLDDILKRGSLDTNYNLVPSDIVTVPERTF